MLVHASLLASTWLGHFVALAHRPLDPAVGSGQNDGLLQVYEEDNASLEEPIEIAGSRIIDNRLAPAQVVPVKGTSVEKLFEEFLTDFTLAKNIRIKNDKGWVKEAELSGLRLYNSEIGSNSQMKVDGKSIDVVIKNPIINIAARYDLRLTALKIPESGTLKGKFVGKGLALKIPLFGKAPGECRFEEGLDIIPVSAESDNFITNLALLDAIKMNVLGIKTELITGVEKGLCKTLLEGPTKKPQEVEAISPAVPFLWIFFAIVFVFGVVGGISRCCYRYGVAAGKQLQQQAAKGARKKSNSSGTS